MIRTLLALTLILPLSAFDKLNDQFRETYAMAKKQAIENLGPIIISNGGQLVLLYKGSREEVSYIPNDYHLLKQIDHIPLMIYLAINDQGKLLKIKKEIGHSKEPILVACSAFLNSDKADPDAFFKELSPLLLKNAEEAAFIQLDALHNQVQKWKKNIPHEAWNKIAVVVIGPQMPRIGEVSMQYFSHLTGKPLEKSSAYPYDWQSSWNGDESKKMRRLVYAESIKTEEEALNLLATHIVDEKIGSVFFDDKARMHCDLLAEAASRRLAEKCEKSHAN